MEVVWVALAVIGVGLLLWIVLAALIFWRILRSDERKLAKRIAKLPFFDKISLAGALFRDQRIGLAPRLIALALVLYLAMPLDLIPDFIPVLGYLDDILIVGIGAVLLLRSIPRYIVKEQIGRYEQQAREAKKAETARR
ncbi:MAG TPA: DUF1232 domain-containing protein [Dehalococcoidia bacterium]|nr:DUF1232 domain-containing protein [Dehalococcoidia bacterium]